LSDSDHQISAASLAWPAIPLCAAAANDECERLAPMGELN
jgi:hypothetical protein